MNTIEIKIPSDPRYLKIVRCGIYHLCQLCGFSDEDGNAITLAVNEAVTNIIRHAYRCEKDRPILINCALLDDRLEIVLRDFGIKPDIKKIKSRDLNDVKPGGLGVHIIKSTMDVVKYDNSVKDENQLTLIKYLPSKKRE